MQARNCSKSINVMRESYKAENTPIWWPHHTSFKLDPNKAIVQINTSNWYCLKCHTSNGYYILIPLVGQLIFFPFLRKDWGVNFLLVQGHKSQDPQPQGHPRLAIKSWWVQAPVWQFDALKEAPLPPIVTKKPLSPRVPSCTYKLIPLTTGIAKGLRKLHPFP